MTCARASYGAPDTLGHTVSAEANAQARAGVRVWMVANIGPVNASPKGAGKMRQTKCNKGVGTGR